jgi:hypothetical protein
MNSDARKTDLKQQLYVPVVEKEMLTLPEHLSSPPVLVGLVLLDPYFSV